MVKKRSTGLGSTVLEKKRGTPYRPAASHCTSKPHVLRCRCDARCIAICPYVFSGSWVEGRLRRALFSLPCGFIVGAGVAILDLRGMAFDSGLFWSRLFPSYLSESTFVKHLI